MQITRDICTAGNAERQKANIPVRQPLTKLEIKNLDLRKEYIELIKEELNVKEVKESKNLENEIELDQNITPALRAEGEYREFMRELQDQRKKLRLNPGDKMPLSIEMIYKKYKILPIMQEHMIRVAAVAYLICDSMDVPVHKENIITALLFHDMGNIIKVDFVNLLEVFEPEGIEYWKKIKDEYITKYGKSEHTATLKIIEELNLNKEVLSIVDWVDFPNMCKNLNSGNINSKIAQYSDMRAGPYGVLSYDERMAEAGKRYKDRKDNIFNSEERDKLVACGKEIEKQIFAKCKIKPEDINDETIVPIIAKLKNFVIPG
jgi:hypothetical protein